MDGCNILFISTSKTVSGAEISLLDMVKKLDGNKFKCFVATNVNPELVGRFPSGVNIFSLKFIWFKRSYNPFYIFVCFANIIINANKLTKIVKKNKIRIIYANTAKACIYGILAKLFTKTKLVWHVRDKVSLGFFSKVLATQSDKIICVSRFIYDQVKCPEIKKQVIYLGIDINKWDTYGDSLTDVRDNLKLKPGVKLIAQIGQITKWKNHRDFIEVAKVITKQYDNVHFIIVGECISRNDQLYKNRLVSIINEYNLGDKISFLGCIQNITEIYRQIDLVLFPSMGEPFGRVVVEAMSMRKPVIAYDIGGPKEIIKNDGNGILVSAGDYKEMARQVIYLLRNEEIMLVIGTCGRKHVVDKYNIHNNIKQIENTIDSLLHDNII